MRASSRRLRLAALFLAATCAASAGPARAADPAEADRLRALFESYLGAPAPGAPSAVAVTPLGDDYELAIDLDRLAAPLAPLGLDLKLGRSLSRLAPKPDGTWAWRSERFEPMSWAYQGRTGRIGVEGWKAEGDFSPALSAFTRQTATADRLVVDQTVPATPDSPRLDVHKVDEGFAVNITATPAAAGVDVAVDQTSRATTQTFTLSEGKAAGVTDMEATLKVGPSHVVATFAGLRTEAMLALWRRLVAHHAPADFTAGQVEFKQVLRDLGPLFQRMTHRATVDAVEVETPVGFGSIGRIEAAVEATGATADGSADVALTLSALEIHSLFIPAWANRLIPRDLALHGKVTGWDAAAALAVFLDRADFAAHDPLDAAARAELVAKALPNGAVTIELAGNRVKATDWDVALDGRLTTGLG
ncbi:MAG: hypothetical protein GX458_04880, partial [Phyllobacteriaceae bacterium]|nr:hypothetical protein [Phyllobacteriaceae bacterium]